MLGNDLAEVKDGSVSKINLVRHKQGLFKYSFFSRNVQQLPAGYKVYAVLQASSQKLGAHIDRNFIL